MEPGNDQRGGADEARPGLSTGPRSRARGLARRRLADWFGFSRHARHLPAGREFESGLADALRRLQQVLRLSRSAVWEIDRDGVFTPFSPYFEDLLGGGVLWFAAAVGAFALLR